MKPIRSVSPWLPLVGVLTAAWMCWFMLVFAGNRKGLVPLPDAAGSVVESLVDKGKKLTITEVESAPDAVWQTWSGQGYMNADRRDALWLRVTLHNPGPRRARAMLTVTEYVNDRVEFWERTDEAPAGWRHEVAGQSVRSADKTVWGRTADFAVEVPVGEGRTFYLRAEDYFAAWVRVAWWPNEQDFHAYQMRDLLAEGGYYGVLLALLFYNTVLWIRLKFDDIGNYVGYLSCMAVFNFVMNEGFALVGWPVASPFAEMIAAGSLALSGVFLAQFARVFLELKARLPRALRVASGVRVGMLIFAAATLVVPMVGDGVVWLRYTVMAVTLSHFVLMGLAVLAWRAGAWHARYFLLAFGALLTGALPAVVSLLSADTQKSAAMGLMAGSAMEMLLLSLAVADRFTLLQREKTVAQTRLVEEIEQRRAIQEAYADELEVEVRERTRELSEANADKDRMIAVLGHDLRSPLTALTGTAELLTQDSAGAEAKSRFIAETAHVGRQVLLLIEDLVLWARLRAGTMYLVELPVAGLLAPVAALYAPFGERRGVVLILPEEALDARVRTDPVLVQTLVRNLVANALRYARSEVRLSAKPGPGGLRVTVCDDGPGLPSEVAARLAPGAVAPDWAGHGLGLRLCVEIGRTLGADLRTATAPGGGTEFSFMLPSADGSVVN